MATEYKTSMVFLTASGGTHTITLKYAKQNPSATEINTAMNAIISNGSIFKTVPTEKKAAYTSVVTKTDINI